MNKEWGIDIAVVNVAEELRKAYSNLQKSQDPLVKDLARQNVIEVLLHATIVTLAAENKKKLSITPPSKN